MIETPHVPRVRASRRRPLRRLAATGAILALVLGDKAEDSFRQAMLMSQGEMGIMYANPLVGTITTLALILLFWPLISWLIGELKPRKPDTVAVEQPVD